MPKLIWRIIAIMMITLFFTPFPGGFIFLAMGLSILICASQPFALWIQACRRRFKLVNKTLSGIENRLGERWAASLMVTRPNADPREIFRDDD